jgi:hypothetical protein
MDMKIIATTLLFMCSSSRRSVLLPAVDELTEEHNYLHLKEQSSFKTTTDIIILSLSLSPDPSSRKKMCPKVWRPLNCPFMQMQGRCICPRAWERKVGPACLLVSFTFSFSLPTLLHFTGFNQQNVRGYQEQQATQGSQEPSRSLSMRILPN